MSSLIEDVPQLIKVKIVKEPNIDTKENVSLNLTPEPCWMDPIIEFLVENCLLSEVKDAEKVRRVSAQF